MRLIAVENKTTYMAHRSQPARGWKRHEPSLYTRDLAAPFKKLFSRYLETNWDFLGGEDSKTQRTMNDKKTEGMWEGGRSCSRNDGRWRVKKMKERGKVKKLQISQITPGQEVQWILKKDISLSLTYYFQEYSQREKERLRYMQEGDRGKKSKEE